MFRNMQLIVFILKPSRFENNVWHKNQQRHKENIKITVRVTAKNRETDSSSLILYDTVLVIEYINSNPLVQLKGGNMIIISLEALQL